MILIFTEQLKVSTYCPVFCLKKHVLFVKQDKYRERAVQALSGFQIQINLPLFR